MMKKLDDRGYEKITWGDLYREETWLRIIMKIIGLVVLGLLVILFMVSTSQAQTFDSEYVDVFYRAGSTKAVYRIQFNDGKDEILKDQSGEPVKTFIVAQEILNGNGYEFVFTYQAFPIHVGVKAEDTHFVFRKVK